MFEVRAREPLIIAAVVAMIGSVGLMTYGLAAHQAPSINPAAALRGECHRPMVPIC